MVLLLQFKIEGSGDMEKYMPFIWIGFAVVMAICEAATTQLVSIWFVVGAVAAAITTIFTPNIFIQLIVFLALIITRPLVKKLRKKDKPVSTNADRLIGKTGIIVSEIKSDQDVGQVKVMGETWSAISKSAPIAKDSKVKVLSIEGVKLIVEPENKED